MAFLEGLEMLRPLGTYVELGCMADKGETVHEFIERSRGLS